ncbi:zinc finger domain-containing protein [Streptomyces poonensis]|uniref:DNA-binding phage zinc finger domain-containing protein n=1 Tax=Streptomyces poonensis TaxID=68255 RepID=A0A918QE06_9ACTN|nr:hypothetical protein [Streptomyces poonensis]GGZ42620.1 hypothetical protein GCM10010365_74110 [Streptomyces poonensis]
MGTENGPQNTWGEWRRHLRSGSEQQLVRDWFRRLECPTCKTAAGRACRTAGGRPTDQHRARRDAAGPIPYKEWRQQGLIPEQRTYTMPAVLKETEKARADFNVDTALADGVAVVRMFLADRLGLFLQGEEAMDRIDDAVRKLIEVRGPVGTADLVTVLASLVTALLSANAGPDGDPDALFEAVIRAQVDMARRMRTTERKRADN